MAGGVKEVGGGTPASRRLRRPALGLLAGAHLSADFCQGVVPAMLPVLVQQRHLSYALAGGLVLGQTVSSSVVQPFFGRLTDRRPLPWLMPGGLAGAGLALGAACLLPAYPLIWLAVALSGLGIAAFHPEGARYARYASGERQATGMSLFSLGGNLGFALGPLATTPLLLTLGLEGGWLVGLLPVAMGLALLLARARLPVGGEAGSSPGFRDAAGRDRWGAFARLTLAVVGRAIAFYGLNTFVPLYWIAVLGRSRAAGGYALTLLLLCGAMGTLLGGRLADRFPRREVIAAGLLLSGPLVLALTRAPNPALATALLAAVGIALFVPTSVQVVLGQEYLPNHIGTASGVTLGLAVSVGGIAAPALGVLGDHAGLRSVLLVLGLLPVLSGIIVLSLPGRRAPVA
ncbi:MAG TPA: MFS transporter [Candidatus Dormibacteraeota bacterium]|nr:MFS transporter [Candidatus Dormibacteraeota bacterium]